MTAEDTWPKVRRIRFETAGNKSRVTFLALLLSCASCLGIRISSAKDGDDP